eukprot:Em0013g181a
MPETGVKGLLKFIVHNPDTREKTSVCQLQEKVWTKTNKKPLLLCDYYSVIAWILSRADRLAIQRKRLSPYSLLFGGNFKRYSRVIMKLVKSLQRLGVQPVFFIDSPPGSNEDEMRATFYELKERHLDQLEQNHVIQQVCDGKRDILQVPWRLREAISVEVEMLLRAMAVPLFFCNGDADHSIVHYSRLHEEVCGVLSTDTVFATIPSIQLLHLDFFDPDNRLIVSAEDSLADPVVGPDHWPTFSDEVGDPLDIVCEVTSAERLARVLGIGASQLIDLSILCGNSYTRELNRYMSTWALLGLADLTVETVAEWLSQETVPLPSNAVIKSICTQVPAYRDAITHSYKVCQGADATSLGHRQGHFRPEGGSGAGRGCSAVTGFAHWRPVTVEATTLGHPCIGDLTLPIRKVWYTLLGLKRVTEYGRVGNKTFAELVVVLGQACPGNLGPLHFVQAMTLRDRVSCLFFLLTSGHHLLEKGESLPTVLSHSVVMGRTLKDPISCQGVLVCTCLLLMAELNSKGQPSPAIRISELEALIVVCLLCCAGVPPCHTTVLPNMRAITIASWFTSILEHAYYTALLLCLCCELPGPSHCFYGLAYVPFHIATVNQNHSEFLTADLGPNVLEARRIFDHVINLPSVLGLRSFILNKSHQCELQHVLDIFAVAVREVSENSAVLTPSEGLDMAIPLEMGYEFDGGATSFVPRGSGRDNSSSESYYFETLGGLHDSEILSDEEEEGTNTLSAEVPLEASRQEYSVQAEKDEADAGVCASPFAKKRSPVRLPVVDHRENIMELIHKHRVVCIQGETGCGKSTKVPQFILDDALSSTSPKACKILVSQPRRVAAMKLAERVAAERHEALGKTVGFAVAGEKRRGSDTAIVYCTTGYLLQMLVHDPFKIEQYTHIVLDEIHERNIDADFAMLVVRKLVSDMPHVKVVLMSATMQVDLVVRYFPVETFFVDDLGGLAERRKNFWHISQGKAASLLKVLATVVLEANKQTLLLRCKPEVTSYMKNLCTEIIISQATLGESILVFLPGMADIITYFESLSEELRDRELSEHFSLFMLHSQIPLQEQRAAFAVPPADRVHLILATNIAESSVTLPRLSLVINFGIYRQLEYNSKRHITCLSHRWCSHASCSQRAGRVGRVCAGTAIHLVTRQFYDAVFPEYDLAAMATAPLSKLVLQAKQIGVKVGVPSVTQLLSLAVEPPSLQQLEAALQDLAHMGAIASLPGTEISEEAPITLLGYVSLSLPVELPLARLVFFGVLFGCACDAVVLAASLSLDQDVFTLPSRLVMEEKKYRASLVRSMKWREYYDGSTYSEPIAVYRMFRDFLQFKMDAGSKRGRSRCTHARLFSQNVAVRYDRLLQLESVVGDISSRMLGHLEKDTAAYGELSKLASVAFSRTGGDDVNVMPTFCDDPDMLKFLLVASFCHQSVFGVTECNSCFKKQRAHAVNLLNTVKELGLDYMRTLAFKNLRNVTQLDLDTVARHILPQHHCQTLIANKTGFIQVSEGFDSNAKDELTCSVTTDLQYEDLGGVGDVGCDRGRNSFCGSDVVSSPIPSELRLLWQYGERRVAWKARPDAAELTRPAHPCSVSWYRMNVEKEMVIPGSWRNIAGFVCELEPCETPFFAVPFMLQGTCNGPTMVARGFTVLPSLKHSARVLRMLVGFQPLSTGVDLFVDRAGRKVIGARINSCLVMFEHHKLTPADMLKINVLRMLISSVVSTVSSDEAIIPCNKATSISWVMQDLLNGVFDHCSVLQELSLTENVEPLEETLEPAWEVASSKPSDTAGIPVALVERCPSLKSFELYPTLACSLVQQNVLKEACSLLLQSVSSGLDETPRGSSEPAVAHIQDPGVSFRLSPTAPPFTPIFASGNIAVHCAAPLHSVPAVASPTPSSSIQNLPGLSHSNNERIPASPASKLAIGSSPLSHFSFPPASPHFHHSPPPRPVTSHTSPLHTDPVPFPSRSHPFQVPLTTPTSPLLPCPAVGSEVDRATLQRALELHILQNYWSSQQQPRQPTPASPSLLKGNSPTSLTTSPVPNSHLEEVQAAMRLMAAVPVFASISRLPPMSPLSNRSPLSARSQVLNPSSVSPSETMPIHPPQMTSLPQGLFFDPQVSKLKMQQRLRVGQPVGDVSTGSAQQRQDLEPPDASPHFVPASPVWSGYQRSVQEVSTDSGPSVTSGDPYQTSMPSISPSTSPSSGKPKAQLEEQRLVEFMVDYIACRGNCVNFSQLCRDAYPSYKQKYSIMGDEMALTWHFFVRHPKIFALFGHPGYCLVQLLVKSSFEAPLGNKESPETGIINCSSRETDRPVKEEQEHTDDVPVTQQEHTDDVPVTQQEHTDDVPVTQQEHTDDVPVTQQEHTDDVPVTQQEHTDDVQVTQQEHTDDVPVTQQEHTDDVQVTQQEHTDDVPVTQQEHTDDVQATQQEHTDDVPVTQQEHTDDVPVTQQEHTDDVQVTQQEHTDGVPVTQQEHDDPVTQQEHDVPVTQQEHDVLVTQQEHDVPVTQQEHDVPVTQQEHDVLVAQQEHNVSQEHDDPVTQQEHDVPVTQQEHDVPVTQQEHDVPVTQQEHDVPVTQQEHDVPVTQQNMGPVTAEHTDDVPITQEENTGKEIQESHKEHIDEVQITQEECTDKHTEDILTKTDVKGVYSTAPDHGESNSKETEWPCLDTEDESGVSEVDKTGCKAGYSLNCYSDSLGFVDFASLDSELPFITQSSDLMELQLLLQSISSASGHTLSLSSAQASTPDRAAVSDPGTCLPHIELCQETTTDLCDHSFDTLTWGGDGLSEVYLSSWTNALSDVHGGPLASSNLLDMSLGEEWFDFSSFITSSDVGCSLSLPASLSSCLMQEPPLCAVDAAEDTKEVMSGTLQRGADCSGTTGEGVFDKDGLFMIDGSATDLCTGLTSEPLGCATSDPCESICTGGEIVDGCAKIAPQCDNTSAFTDTVEAETSSRVSLCTDQTQLTSSTSTYGDVLFCSQSSGISHSAQTVAHCGSLSQSNVVPTPSVSILEQKGTFADTKWKLQKQETEERGASVSRVDQLDDAPDVVELSALPVCSEAVEGSPGKSVGVGKEKTMPFSVESHSAPRKPLVPYHLLDRQRRSLPGTECHKTSYFMDYLMFSGGGAYYNQLAQVFREQYIPTFRLKGGVQQFLKFFRERNEYFILYEVPGGHFIRLRTLSYAPESTLSVEARKCGFIAAACRTLAYEEKGLQVGKLKRRSDLMRRVKLLHVDMLQLLGSCPDFFTVSSSTDSGHCVGLTSKAASVQKEFLPYYKRGSRSTPRDSSKTRRLMPTVEVTSLCVRRREAALQPLTASSANCEKRSSESPVSCDEIGKGIVEESCNKSSGVPMDAKRPKARSMLKWAICNDMLQKDRDGKRSVETSVPNFTAECDHVACKDGEKKPKERSTKKVKFQIFSDN